MSQFIEITFSPTGKIFYRIHSNSFFLDCNKKHKINLFSFASGELQEKKLFLMLVQGWLTDFQALL